MRCLSVYLSPASVHYFSVDNRSGIEVVVVVGRNLPDFHVGTRHPLPFVCSDLLPLPALIRTCGRPCTGPIPHLGLCRVDAQTQIEPLDLRVRRGRRPAAESRLPVMAMPTRSTATQASPAPTLTSLIRYHTASRVSAHPLNAVPISSDQSPAPAVPATMEVPGPSTSGMQVGVPGTSSGSLISVRRISTMLAPSSLGSVGEQPSSTYQFPMPFVIKEFESDDNDTEVEKKFIIKRTYCTLMVFS